MKYSQFIKYSAAGLSALLILAGCNAGDTSSAPASSVPAPSSSTPAASQQQAVGGVLPGVNAENYPRIDGSTANLPLLAQMYSEICGVSLDEAETKISISGGTGAVWRHLIHGEGEVELLVVYEAPEEVKQELADSSLELEIDPIGRDGLVFLANKKNTVDNLSIKQLQDIYTGKITDWSEVGGESGPIAAFQRNEESGSQTLFRKLLMQGLTPMQAPTELVPGFMGELIDSVATYDGEGGSLGYSVYYYADLMYGNPDLKLLSVDGVAPSHESIQDGSYPLINDFYVVLPSDTPQDHPARLVRDWLLGEDGKDLLKRSGYVAIDA